MISNQLHEELHFLNRFLPGLMGGNNHRLLLILPDGSFWSRISVRMTDSGDWEVCGSCGSSMLLTTQPISHFHFVACPCADLISLSGREYDSLRDFLLSWHIEIQALEAWYSGDPW